MLKLSCFSKIITFATLLKQFWLVFLKNLRLLKFFLEFFAHDLQKSLRRADPLNLDN